VASRSQIYCIYAPSSLLVSIQFFVPAMALLVFKQALMLKKDQTVTYRLTLAYHGSAFAGWQRQPGKTTVQGCLEDAAHKIWKQPISVQGSGRTDTGVHAFGQVASFEAPAKHSPQILARAFNAHLPLTVRVTALRRAPEDFHARFSAAGKIYE